MSRAKVPPLLVWSSAGAFAGILFGCILWIGSPSNARRHSASPEGDAELLYVEKQELSFGEVWAQPSFKWPLRIQNPSHSTVHIDGFSMSCACVGAEPEAVVLGPRSSAPITFMLDLLASGVLTGADEEATFNVMITPVGGPTMSPLINRGWRLTGRVTAPFQAAISEVDFGSSLVHEAEGTTQSVELTAHPGIASLEVCSDQDWITASVSPGPDRHYELHVTVTPKFVGTFSSDLLICPVSVDGEQLAEIPYRVRGEISRDLAIGPQPINVFLSDVNAEATSTAEVTTRTGRSIEWVRMQSVENAGDTAVRIMTTRSSPNVVRITVSASNAHRTQPLAVRFLVKVSGVEDAYDIRVPVVVWRENNSERSG